MTKKSKAIYTDYVFREGKVTVDFVNCKYIIDIYTQKGYHSFKPKHALLSSRSFIERLYNRVLTLGKP